MRSITVSGQTLFSVALEYLGDATLWSVIAELNGLTDPWLSGVQTLQIPDSAVTVGGGLGN